jgi:hypothetical protein
VEINRYQFDVALHEFVRKPDGECSAATATDVLKDCCTGNWHCFTGRLQCADSSLSIIGLD